MTSGDGLEPADIDGTIRALEPADQHVALVEYDGSLDGHEPVTVKLGQFEEFIERCRSMGWEEVRLYVRDNSAILAREQGDDGDLFVGVGLAAILVDGNEEVDLDK